MNKALLRKAVLIKVWGAIELWRVEASYGDAWAVLSPGTEDVIYEPGAALDRVKELRAECLYRGEVYE